MTRAAPRDTTGDRLRSSILLAVLLHALAFVALELFLKLAPQRAPEYSGPLFVQLEEQPVVQQARQPAPAAPAGAPGQAPAGAGAASPAVSRSAEAAPPVPSGPPLRTAAPAAEAQARAGAATPTGSPFRVEGAPTQQGQPRPAGQGFQVPSEEPTLPPSGAASAGAVSPQGPPLRAVAPGAGGKGPAVPLEEVDRALASGAARQGAAGAAGGAQAGSPGASGAGQGDTSREGISIAFADPARGREPSYTPLPVIPKWVSEAGLRLSLEISFVLTPQGVLHSVQKVKSSGYSDVDSAVLDAVRRWKFRPAPAGAGTVQGIVSYLIVPRQ
jgi:TonB family protein